MQLKQYLSRTTFKNPLSQLSLHLFKTIISYVRFISFLLTLFFLPGLAEAQDIAAQPYTITQGTLRIAAKPYAPYDASPMSGATSVFANGQLLYTIDSYYREPLYTNNDGSYLIMVRSTDNANGETDKNTSALEVYKNGKSIKRFSFSDLTTAAGLKASGQFYNWGYEIAWDEAMVESVVPGCEACMNTYGEQLFRDCPEEKIYVLECMECQRLCDSFKLYQQEQKLAENSVFVRNDTLFAATNQQKVVVLPLTESPKLHSLPVSIAIPDKATFAAPERTISFTSVNFPEEFDAPTLADGADINEALVAYMEVPAIENITDTAARALIVERLLVNKNGKCEQVKVEYYKEGIKPKAANAVLPQYTNSELLDKVEEWLQNQEYDTALIPEGFEKYCFYTLLFL